MLHPYRCDSSRLAPFFIEYKCDCSINNLLFSKVNPKLGRDLFAKIKAKSDAMVTQAMVTEQVTPLWLFL